MASTRYADKNSMVHTVHPGWETGDLVILSDCKCAWRVRKANLASISVLKVMFNNASADGDELLISEASALAMEGFLSALSSRGKTGAYTYPDVFRSVELLTQFDCANQAKQLLYRASADLSAANLFPAFALASRMDDILSAVRILGQGDKAAAFDVKRSVTPLTPHCTWRPWTTREANQVQASWVWALQAATAAGFDRRRKKSLQLGHLVTDSSYWRTVAGEFVSTLAQ